MSNQNDSLARNAQSID